MDLRTLADGILNVVGSSSLTDDEFATIVGLAPAFTVEFYGALLAVLDSRETVSNTRDRLNFYFRARGVEVGELTPPKSNIFLGSVL